LIAKSNCIVRLLNCHRDSRQMRSARCTLNPFKIDSSAVHPKDPLRIAVRHDPRLSHDSVFVKNLRCLSLIGFPSRSNTCSMSSQTLRFSVTN
jgi:hypothetical protein